MFGVRAKTGHSLQYIQNNNLWTLGFELNNPCISVDERLEEFVLKSLGFRTTVAVTRNYMYPEHASNIQKKSTNGKGLRMLYD
jgi:hypothetical protein